MNNQTPFERHRQLRDVAILVASLDEVLAQRLLNSMPAKDAAAVLAEADELELIDPEEQREIAEKFRRSLAPQPVTKLDGVELDASLLAKLEDQNTHEFDSSSSATHQPLETLSEAEASALVKILSAEHPQTIAIILSRIEASKAAELMTKLALSLQAEVLARMGNLDTADEQTVQVVEAQLARWIKQQRKHKQRQAAGMELVQSILQHTPDAHRKTILAHMDRNTPNATKPTPALPSKIRSELTPPVQAPTTDNVFKNKTTGEIPTRPPLPTSPRSIPQVVLSKDPLAELEETDETTLMAALSQADRQVSALALAGASELLMQRVLQRLPRRQAKAMRRQLRAIGPTRLSDMVAAQHQLLQSVRQLKNQSTTSSLS